VDEIRHPLCFCTEDFLFWEHHRLGQVTLITGGIRSGKSRYALQRAESLGERRLFIATAEPADEEMRLRIACHQKERAQRNWHVAEVPLLLSQAVSAATDCDVLLIDCLTIWVSNLMWKAEQQQRPFTEDDMRNECERLLTACRAITASVVFVTNEVGFGGIAADPVARRFADVLGRANRAIAEGADNAILVVCGQPFILKGK
jgi:adenosylcobinamide kinase/adenosylcobinamide-phosphate guanylyltransferase